MLLTEGKVIQKMFHCEMIHATLTRIHRVIEKKVIAVARKKIKLSTTFLIKGDILQQIEVLKLEGIVYALWLLSCKLSKARENK